MHLGCETCGASLLVDPNQRTAVCPYCASPSVVERPPSIDRPEPHFVVGFTMTREGAQGAVKEWLGKRSFFVQAGVKGGSVDSIRGVYAPAYLYSGMAQTRYAAQIGENYQETETYTTTDEKGNTVVRTRTVTRTEYRDLDGQHATYVMDVLVSASRALPNPELEGIEPFDLRTMRRFSPAVISGWIAEEPTMSRDACYGLARGEALEKIGRELSEFMPGDSHHGLTYQTILDRETTELIYVPIWVLAIRHDPRKPPLRVLINGQTGRVHGKAPLSWIKIVLVVLVVLLVLATPIVIIALRGGGRQPRRGAQPAATLGPVAAPTTATTKATAPPAKQPAPARPTATTKPTTGGVKPAPTGGKR